MRARVGLLIVGGAIALSAPQAAAAVADCDGFEPVAVAGTVGDPALVELSGLAASRTHAGVLWAHNDSGAGPELHAIGLDGAALGTYSVDGAEAVDWEDIAAGPGPDGEDVLYVGDIGDNQARRPTVTVYRVSEPATAPAGADDLALTAEAIELRYPGGPVDAEALLVDPRSGDLVIVTKSLVGRSRVLVASADALVPGAAVELRDAGPLVVPRPAEVSLGLPGTAVTGGDVSPDGSLVALRTYRSILLFERADGASMADALLGEPCFAPQAEEPQGEAVAFTADGAALVTASEGEAVPLNRTDLTTPPTTTTTPPATTSGESTEGADDGDDGLPVAGIVLVVAVAAAGVLAVWAARRSRSGSG